MSYKRPPLTEAQKVLARARSRSYRARHPAKVKERRWKANSDIAQRICSRAKWRAKRDGVPFKITAADLFVPKKCPILGMCLVVHRGASGFHRDSPSIDRMIPELGYVRGNVRIISSRANFLKRDGSIKELRAILKYMTGVR